MRKWLNLKRGTFLVAALVALSLGIAYALTEFKKDVTASVTVSLKVPDGIEVYADENLTQPVDSLPFGEVELDVFGTVREPPRKPVWVMNHSNSVIRLRLEDDLTFGQVLFGFGGTEPRPSPDHSIVVEPEQVVAGEVGLRFFEGVTGDHQFTISFIAEGPILIPTPTATSPAPTATTVPTPTPAGLIKPGGELRVLTHRDVRNYDPVYHASFGDQGMLRPMYNGLLEYAPGSYEIVGKLAESWQVGADGETLTLKLRSGVVWHDGTPFAAEDVVYTLDAMANPPEGARSLRKATALLIDSVQTPDPSQVVVKTKFLALVTALFAESMIAPKHWHPDNAVVPPGNGVGTGPFKLVAHGGEKWSYGRNPGYFLPGLPYLDRVTHVIVKDHTARQVALRTGQGDIDWVDWRGVGPEFIEQVRQEQPELGIELLPRTNLYGIVLNLDLKDRPWADLKVRQAMNLAINRDDILKGTRQGILAGFFYPPPYLGFSPEKLAASPGFGPDMAGRLAQAKDLMRDAGYADGFEATIHITGQPPHDDSALIIQAQLQEIGVRLNIEPTDSKVFLGKLAEGAFPLAFRSFPTAGFDPNAISVFYESAGIQNVGIVNYRNAEVDSLFAAQRREADPDKRQRIIDDIQAILFQDLPAIPLFVGTGYYVKYNYVKNFDGKLLNDQSHPQKTFEQAWLDK